jgi:hypothetical protein
MDMEFDRTRVCANLMNEICGNLWMAVAVEAVAPRVAGHD